MGHTQPLDVQFWRYVEAGDAGACWEWKASRRPTGYGQMRRLGKNLKAHRVSWELHYGPIPEGMVVMHECDNPPCCNPVHLRLGTQSENMEDMREKARGVTTHHTGERNPASKLTRAQVVEMRRRHGDGEFARALAREFGINHKTALQIVKGQIWKG